MDSNRRNKSGEAYGETQVTLLVWSLNGESAGRRRMILTELSGDFLLTPNNGSQAPGSRENKKDTKWRG